MPARNLYHDAVVDALKADGWTVTDDPLYLEFGGRDLYVDLAAEKNTLAAERDGERIAVEIQSFVNKSDVRSLQEAVGQYAMYRTVLTRQDPDRPLFLAVAAEVYNGILSEPLGQAYLADMNVRLLVFDPDRREVIRWTS